MEGPWQCNFDLWCPCGWSLAGCSMDAEWSGNYGRHDAANTEGITLLWIQLIHSFVVYHMGSHCEWVGTRTEHTNEPRELLGSFNYLGAG